MSDRREFIKKLGITSAAIGGLGIAKQSNAKDIVQFDELTVFDSECEHIKAITQGNQNTNHYAMVRILGIKLHICSEESDWYNAVVCHYNGSMDDYYIGVYEKTCIKLQRDHYPDLMGFANKEEYLSIPHGDYKTIKNDIKLIVSGYVGINSILTSWIDVRQSLDVGGAVYVYDANHMDDYKYEGHAFYN